MHKSQHGLTLIELMVVLAIAAILAFLAVPSFTSMIRSNAISGSVNTFLSDMRYARSEAIRLGGGVVVCRSDDPESATPACGTGHGPGNKGWVSGWIIFHDLDNDGAWDSGERVLRVQAAMSSPDQIVEDGASSSTVFRFTATGRLLSSASATTMRFGSAANGTARRTVCVNAGGRARADTSGSAVCE
ncbi:MAG: GspH/FimT family pseudopilin [Proteobacteria bacterium]|jgi:type IV fimbrial biogenesis protein FimT|nr:GspH/FimT family pseudopilin [Ramlibacter sp.]MCA0214074.1 GspH/FimT family pseudopilin [Pseudomonadota bacterium]